YMERRTFFKNGILAGAAAFSGISTSFSSALSQKTEKFNMKFSPEFGIFADAAGGDLVDQIKWGHDQGFRAWENTYLKRRPVEEQELISKTVQKLGMEFGQFVGTMNFKEVTFAGRDEN